MVQLWVPGYPLAELPKITVEKDKGLTADQLKELQVV
jgi:hypothetical protein